tara:strand:- start:1322 stop:1792 length:471 start_codon:yes stop_codon:yes gene_type:complete
MYAGHDINETMHIGSFFTDNPYQYGINFYKKQYARRLTYNQETVYMHKIFWAPTGGSNRVLHRIFPSELDLTKFSLYMHAFGNGLNTSVHSATSIFIHRFNVELKWPIIKPVNLVSFDSDTYLCDFADPNPSFLTNKRITQLKSYFTVNGPLGKLP